MRLIPAWFRSNPGEERNSNMKKWNLIIDVEKCEDCNNCFLACKDEHVDNDWPGYSLPQPLHGHRWMNIMRKERGQFPMIDVAYLPIPCMHCDRAPCIEAAKGGAVYKRDDGIVIIDPEKAPMIQQAIREGVSSHRMQSFDQSLMQLLTDGRISMEEAMKNSSNPHEFSLRLKGIQASSDTTWDSFEVVETGGKDSGGEF